ncbi:hypothetical protein Q4574_11985 [Aliiglaciecola sp. 3_MG-2023]|uniref:hypothetical protein n=1 Tax=Aliiglaciecola sp. 3_MG-2023 TaxID=3062644 RepID=UPI0026E3646D|nr:hypothetical protein [Aliiglaciecola sp. 3_MG-2023]MDO6694005.1 hypothetical protein [Aliiglaciecola sp. 3_MG-2023]
MNEFDKSYKKDVSAVNKRRNFLKKSATGAVIVSLPAKSVWGTTCNVSGNLSGNLSTSTHEKTCTIPDLNYGCRPHKWKDSDSNCDDMFDKLKEMNHGRHRRDDDDCKKEREKYNASIDAVKSCSLNLPKEFFRYSDDSCGNLLSGNCGSSYQKLGAVFLNACFGFYPGYEGLSQAEDLCKEVFVYLYVKDKTGSLVTDNELGMTDNHRLSNWEPS